MTEKKAQASRLFLSFTVLLFGSLGILFWGLGIINNSLNSTWIGKVILGVIALVVLIMEKWIK